MSVTSPQNWRVSIVHMHSIGTVAKNLDLNSNAIEVRSDEDTPFAEGEITDNASDATIRSKDTEGGYSDVKVTSTPTLPATWMPFGSNRFTPPNIRRGEKVVIWRVGDSETYYWSEYEYNPDLRKLETIIWLFSDTQKEDEKATPENSWFFEVSTHRKIIHIHTGKNDGEPFAYDIQLDAKQGVFLMTDDIENQFSLESLEKRWSLSNADGTYFQLDKKDIIFNAIENIRFKAGKNLSYDVGGNMTHKVVGDWAWSAANTTGKTAEAKYTIPKTTYTGLVDMGGFNSRNEGGLGFNVSGNGTFTGKVGITQDLEAANIRASGNIAATGTVSGSNI